MKYIYMYLQNKCINQQQNGHTVDCVWSARFDTYLGLANSFINFSCVLLTVYIHGQVYWDSPITYFIKSSQYDFKLGDSSPSPISNFTKFAWHDFKMGDISDDNQPRRASNIQAHGATSFTLKPHTIELSAWMAEMDGIYVRMLCLFNSIVLGPVTLTVLRSNLKFDKNLECSRLKYAQPITAIVCTCHDSYTVVTCAKFHCDRYSIF